MEKGEEEEEGGKTNVITNVPKSGQCSKLGIVRMEEIGEKEVEKEKKEEEEM